VTKHGPYGLPNLVPKVGEGQATQRSPVPVVPIGEQRVRLRDPDCAGTGTCPVASSSCEPLWFRCSAIARSFVSFPAAPVVFGLDCRRWQREDFFFSVVCGSAICKDAEE